MIISRKEANDEISAHLQNVSEANSAFGNLKSPQSKKYFTSAPQSFIFHKAEIEQLWQLNPEADGLKVYKGCHADGSPTIVLVACKTITLPADAANTPLNKSSNIIGSTNLVASEENGAVQWPGGGGIGSAATFDIATDNG